MTWVLKLAKYNEFTAAFLGVFLNLLLLYIVSTVKSKLGNISRILLQNCFMDILLAITSLLAGIHTVSINGTYHIIMGSPLNVFGFECASFVIAIFGSSLMLSIQTLPIPFYVRYQMLCKKRIITIQKFVFLYSLSIATFFGMFFITLWCYPPFESQYEPFKAATMTEFWLDEFPEGPVFVARKTEEIPMLSLLGFAFFVGVLTYGLVIFYSISMTRHLRSHANSFKQTKIQNKQLHWTLIAQVIGPLIVGNLPLCILVILICMGIENNYISAGLSSMMGWIGVVNPLAALIIITPYRRRIAEVLKLRKHLTSTTKISVIPFSIANSVIAFKNHIK